jgi:vacuolar protein sorting-associated protein 45
LNFARYETHSNNDIVGLTALLKNRGIGADAVKTVANVLEYGGAKARSSDLFGTQDAVKITKRLFQGLKEVENIYTQHQPHLLETVRDLSRGRLRESQFPLVDLTTASGGQSLNQGQQQQQQQQPVPGEVIVFFVGGATYEESAAVFQFNNSNPQNCRVILGGTCVHNTESFLEEVAAAVEGVNVRFARRLVT